MSPNIISTNRILISRNLLGTVRALINIWALPIKYIISEIFIVITFFQYKAQYFF